MRVLIVCTVILTYANAAPTNLVPPGEQTFAYKTAIPTISSSDIQAATIDAQVKYADEKQAAADKARLISEQAVNNLNENIQSSVSQDEVKLADTFWMTEDKKWQNLDAVRTAEAQLDGAIASNAPALAKSALLGNYATAIVPFPAVVSYSEVPSISSGDMKAAVINARVKYADLAQAAIDKAREITESAQSQLNSARVGAAEGSYIVPGIIPFSTVPQVNPIVYSGFVAPASKSISNQFLLQTHPATNKVATNELYGTGDITSTASSTKEGEFNMKTADISLNSVESKPFGFAQSMNSAGTGMTASGLDRTNIEQSIKAAVASTLPGVRGNSDLMSTEQSAKNAEPSPISEGIEKSAIEPSIEMGSNQFSDIKKSDFEQPIKAAVTSMLSGRIDKSEIKLSTKSADPSLLSGDLERTAIEQSIKNADIGLLSGGSESSEIDPSIPIADTSSDLDNSKKSEAVINASENLKESERFDLEKSLKTAQAALEAAKSDAYKAFASIQSSYVGNTLALRNAYLTSNIYPVSVNQPIVSHLQQPIAPVISQVYLKTLC